MPRRNDIVKILVIGSGHAMREEDALKAHGPSDNPVLKGHGFSRAEKHQEAGL
jgi:hypothetical protein